MRIQSRTAKNTPATETIHQVTTDMSGPLFSAGLLTQESMEDIWKEPENSGSEARNIPGASLRLQQRLTAMRVLIWDKTSVYVQRNVGTHVRYRRNAAVWLDRRALGHAADLPHLEHKLRWHGSSTA